MNTKINCKVIEDLMPSYIDGLCSDESKSLIGEHILECRDCREKLTRMEQAEPDVSQLKPEAPELMEVINNYKAKDKRLKTSVGILSALSGALVIALVVSLVGPSMISRNDTAPVVATSEGEPSDSSSATSDVKSDASTPMDVTLGIASATVLGDYKAAGTYDRIYDYFWDMYKDWYSYDTGGYAVAEESIAYSSSAMNDGMVMKEEAAAVEAPMEAAVTEVAEDMAAGASVQNRDFSTTNLMTTGVDESDISKTDGDYIYNATGSEIIIFDIRQGEAEKINSFMPKFESPSDIIREIYVDNGIMDIITEHSDFDGQVAKEKVTVLVYNIKNPESPEYLGSYSQDGTYNTSRKTGDIIYLFTDKYISNPGKDKTLAVNDNLSDWFPTVNNKKISPDCIFLPEYGSNSFTVSSFDHNNPGETIDAKVIVNDYVQIYVSGESIYLYSSTYSGGRDITKISKLSYDEGVITPGPSTDVRGSINDSFAINENKGYLRLVTTEWSDVQSNMLYVFDKDLKETGRINNIANGESLYSCRFMGDIGYFVTYEQTDPLFTVDLKDPQNPVIIGELKLLGFSEYLHFWGSDKLLGLGYDSDEDGVRTGIKLSMFDISDPANVTEEGRLTIEGDYAPGFYNYKSVLVSSEKNLIGFAYEDYDDENWVDNKAYYDVFSYEPGSFTKTLSQEIKETQMFRTRGHYSRDNLYISMDTEVISKKL